MTQEETAHAVASDVVVKASPDSAGVPTDADLEQSQLGDDGFETAEAKAVVTAPSEAVKGQAVADLPAGDAAEDKETEQSAAQADEQAPPAEPSAPQDSVEDPVAEAEPAATPAPEAAPEETQVVEAAPTPSSGDAPETVEPEASPAAEPEPAAAATTEAAQEVAAPEAVPEAKPDGEQQQAATPTANGTASTAVVDDASAVQPGTVQEITKRLSGASLVPTPLLVTPTKPTPGEKQQASVPVAAAAVLGARLPSRSPSGNVRSGEASPVSTHDTKNTINVSQLLKLGAFKMQPLKDFVPYADLLRLRVEDGIDATRKEDYLSDADFKEVFGMDRDAFKKQPAWRQAQAKKKANLY